MLYRGIKWTVLYRRLFKYREILRYTGITVFSWRYIVVGHLLIPRIHNVICVRHVIVWSLWRSHCAHSWATNATITVANCQIFRGTLCFRGCDQSSPANEHINQWIVRLSKADKSSLLCQVIHLRRSSFIYCHSPAFDRFCREHLQTFVLLRAACNYRLIDNDENACIFNHET